MMFTGGTPPAGFHGIVEGVRGEEEWYDACACVEAGALRILSRIATACCSNGEVAGHLLHRACLPRCTHDLATHAVP
eukprot:364985-Chlamydomonas_euryale.AAC.5